MSVFSAMRSAGADLRWCAALALALGAILGAGGGPAWAQLDPESLGSATNPDLQFPQSDEMREEGRPRTVTIPETAPVRPPAGAALMRLRLTDLVIEGMTVYRQAEFQPLYRDLLGSEVSLADLYGIAAKIQARYRADGYFLSRVIVPPQEVRDGPFRLQVVEGHISSIETEGPEHRSFRMVRAFLARAMEERPLRLRTLEEALLLANDLPGLTVNVLLRRAPGTPGATVLVMLIERDPLSGYATVDNQGSVFTGRDTMAARVSSQGRTRFGEQISLTAVVSNPFKPFGNVVVQGAGSMALGRSGLRLNGLVSYGESRPGFILEGFGVKSESVLGSVGLVLPIRRSRDLSLSVGANFEMLNSNSDSAFFVFTNVRDRIRTVSLEGRAEWNDRFHGAGRGRIEVRQGLPILGYTTDTDPGSRFGATGVFTSVRVEMERVQPLSRRFSLKTSVRAQYATDNVLSGEEFTAGGRAYGRGYNYAELSGDHGVAAMYELRYSRASRAKWLNGYQIFGFVDTAKVWKNDLSFFGIDDTDPLISAGAGVRATVFDRISIEFVLAKPLTRPTYRGADAGKGRGPQALIRATAAF